ncbi:ATP-grasp domain-containing protein [Mycoplasmatota bacterium WC44]
MKAVIFLNTTESGTCREILKSAKRLGYKVILFTDIMKQFLESEKYNEVDMLIYIEYITYDEIKPYILRYIIDDYEIEGIFSFIDGYVSVASKLADEFSNNVLNTKAIEIMEDKFKTRMLFKEESFTPNFSTLMEERDRPSLKFPLIFKESISSASKGVKRINSRDELTNFVTSEAFLEEYIPGKQYLIELLVKKGIPYVIAKIEQKISQTDFNTFIIKGYSLNKNFKLNMLEINMINKIVSKLDVQNGHFHIEYRKNKNGVKLIEINPRMSGSGMFALLEEALGINYTDEMLRFYLGEDITIPKIKKNCYAHYFLSNKQGVLSKVTGKLKTINTENINRVYIKPKAGQQIRTSESMADRYGYIIGTGISAKEAKMNTLAASKKIKFHILKNTYINLVLFVLLVIVLSLYFRN